jgi:hypothetical protein
MKLSIIVPTIRTHLLARFIDSVRLSCVKHTYEIIFIGPFELPDNLKAPNIQHIHSYFTVPVCIQIATSVAKGELVCHAVDDSVFYGGTLDRCIELFHTHGCDVVGLTYVENTNDMAVAEKWLVKNISEFDELNVEGNWTTFVQPMMKRSLFAEVGGFDCSFEYSNHSHHDLAFRFNMMNASIIVAPFCVSYAFHMPERTGDHAPIHDAQTGPDELAFWKKWTGDRPDIVIPYINWIDYAAPWVRRFKSEYASYEEMVNDQ